MMKESHVVPENDARIVFRPHADTIARKMSDGTILLQLKTNAIYELNGTAGRLWELIVALGDRRAIHAQLLAEYQVDDRALGEEIDALLQSLLEANLITQDERA
jgi:hypothetical protein